jgi:hypothetical protein
MYWIILIGFGILSWWVSNRLKKRFREYSEIPTSSGLTGAEVALRMLRDNNIKDVTVTTVEGELTDHYNPQHKTINLSKAVYYGKNVSAAAIAAHETGHAVQHATAYAMLQFRSAMVPVVNLSSKLMNVIFIVAILGGAVFGLMHQPEHCNG